MGHGLAHRVSACFGPPCFSPPCFSPPCFSPPCFSPPCFSQVAWLWRAPGRGGGVVMRFGSVGACAACAVIAGAAAAIAEEAGYGQPSCIASTLPAAEAQLRVIPAEIKGAPLVQVRGVVVGALTWKPGQTIKVCFHGGSRQAQERVARVATAWI